MCQLMHGRALTAKYDGYASCPLLVGDGKAILAEFIYGGVPQEVLAPAAEFQFPVRVAVSLFCRRLVVLWTRAGPWQRSIISRRIFSLVGESLFIAFPLEFLFLLKACDLCHSSLLELSRERPLVRDVWGHRPKFPQGRRILLQVNYMFPLHQ